MASYQYVPLDPKSSEIRLLRLELGFWDTEIQCHLHHAFLDQKQSYEALSCTWGDANNIKSISLGRCRYNVTANLEVALRYLRSETETRTLWIDALCINQGDLQERSEQVPRIREIYATATTILAWVGEPSHNSTDAMSLLRELGTALTELEWGKDIPVVGMGPDHLRQIGFDPSGKPWEALWELLNRPYWMRVWVLQELVAGGSFRDKDDDRCLIGCGRVWEPKRFVDNTVFLLTMALKSPSFINVDDGTISEPVRTLLARGAPFALEMFRGMLMVFGINEDGDARGLVWLMYLSRSLEATDVRDKVYALVGIARTQDRAFAADYSKPAEKVFKDLIAFLIQKDRRLDCLLHNRMSPNSFGPSWTPCLSGRPNEGFGWANWKKYYDASKGFDADVYINEDDGFLAARGIRLGTMGTVIGPMTAGQGLASEHSQISDLHAYYESGGFPEAEFTRLLVFTDALPELDYDCFWRTLVMDQDLADFDNPIGPAPEEFGDRFREFFDLKRTSPNQQSQSSSNALGRFGRNIEEALANRCFFTTIDGKMGLGPYRSQPEDIVAVVLGASFCLVLRPVKGGTYELIGDAYVHGAMHGEYVRDLVAGETASWGEQFVLS